MKKRGKGLYKSGQIQITFGMIFSIILIVAFVGAAFWGIWQFMKINKCAQAGIFKTDLQHKIDVAWNAPSSDDFFNGTLPSKIQYVCFVDFNSEKKETSTTSGFYDKFELFNIGDLNNPNNVVLYPTEDVCAGQKAFRLEHIDIATITETRNPYCVLNKNGDVDIVIEKNLREALVRLR